MVNEMDRLNIPMNEHWNLEVESIEFDKDTLLNSMILKAGTLEPLYTDPYFFKQMSDAAWDKWYGVFQKWWTATEKQYEPLWDRNGWEEIEDETINDGTTAQTTANTEVVDDDGTMHSTSTEVMDDDTTSTLHQTEVSDEDMSVNKTSTSNNESNSTASKNTTYSVSAFNQGPPNTYSPKDHTAVSDTGHETTTATGSENTVGTDDKTITTDANTTGTDDRTTTITADGTTTDDRTTTFDGQVDGQSHNKETFGHKMHTWGNWGILTTSQKLLLSEIESRYRTNPYQLMTEVLCRELLVRVY